MRNNYGKKLPSASLYRNIFVKRIVYIKFGNFAITPNTVNGDAATCF